MAKSRRNRRNAAVRKDPISKPIKPPSDPELAALREAKILPVVRDLQSADPKSRSAAAAAVSSIIHDTKCRKLLLREQIVHTILAQTLTDAALESRAAGWGILQVLAQEEEPDFCVHLYRVDILTAIEYASKSFSETLRSKDHEFHKLPKAEQKVHLSIASSIVLLLTALAEAQDDILDAIATNPTIVRLLFLLSSGSFANSPDVVALRSDTLACLMILSEDNEKLAEIIVASKDPRCYETLLALRKETNSDAVLACGVLHNVFSALEDQDGLMNADDSWLVPTLARAVASFQPEQIATSGTGWSSPVEVQQLALEILASIGMNLNTSSDSGPSPKADFTGTKDDEDMGDASEDEAEAAADGDEEDDEMDHDEMEADMDMVTGVDDDDDAAANIDDLPVLKALLSTALPEMMRVAATPPTNDDALKLQGHALAALNNMAWSVSLIDLAHAHNAAVSSAWTPAARAIWQQVVAPILASDTADIGLATHVTSLAWALARSFRCDTAAPLEADEHRKFMALYQATKASPAAQDPNDPFQALGVKCIGVLGQLALDPAPAPLNREIGTFLVTLVSALPNTPAAETVEALNQLFDIYGDEKAACDKEVFWKDNFLKHLEEALPKARAMLKTIDKRAQGELRMRADEAVLNLNRFLAYKRKNKP